MELPKALRRTMSRVRLECLMTYTTKHIIDGIAIFKIFFRSGQLSGIEVPTAASAVASEGTLLFLLYSFPCSLQTLVIRSSVCHLQHLNQMPITGPDAVSKVVVNGLQMIKLSRPQTKLPELSQKVEHGH
jgi:hypothetical protein